MISYIFFFFSCHKKKKKQKEKSPLFDNLQKSTGPLSHATTSRSQKFFIDHKPILLTLRVACCMATTDKFL